MNRDGRDASREKKAGEGRKTKMLGKWHGAKAGIEAAAIPIGPDLRRGEA